MNIVGILAGAVNLPRAIHIYRITMPLAYIDKKTKHVAGWTDGKTAMLDLTKAQLTAVFASDIVVLGRPIAKDPAQVYQYIQLLKHKGAKVVYETDDDLTETYRDISEGNDANCVPFLQYCDAITCTTEPLKERLSVYTPRPIYTINNHIEPIMFARVLKDYKREYDGTTNILLVGTATHGKDWELAAKAISQLLEEYDNVRLLVGGFNPDYIKIDREKVFHMNFRPYAGYPTMLAEADIVVAAINPDDPFNHCKSAVKAMEAWTAVRKIGKTTGGAAVVATDSIVYNPVVTHKRNGLLCKHSVESYYDAIKTLLDDTYLRRDLQRRGYLDVIKYHGIAKGYQKWVSAYKKILRS